MKFPDFERQVYENQEKTEVTIEKIFLKTENGFIDISPDRIPTEFSNINKSKYIESKIDPGKQKEISETHPPDPSLFPDDMKMFQTIRLGSPGAEFRFVNIHWEERDGNEITKRPHCWLTYTSWGEDESDIPEGADAFYATYFHIPVPVDKAPNEPGAEVTTVIESDRTSPGGTVYNNRYDITSKCLDFNSFIFTIACYRNGELRWETQPSTGHIGIWDTYWGVAGSEDGEWSYEKRRNGGIFDSGGYPCDVTYIIRRLKLKFPLPEIEYTPGEDITFENKMIWSEGGFAPGTESEPQWKVEIFDPNSQTPDIPVASSDWQDGSLISWAWDGAVAASAGSDAIRGLNVGKKCVLIPSDKYHSYKYKNRRNRNIQKDDDTVVLTYVITANAICYGKSEITPASDDDARYFLRTKKDIYGQIEPVLEIYDDDENLVATSEAEFPEPPYPGYTAYPVYPGDVAAATADAMRVETEFFNIPNNIFILKEPDSVKVFRVIVKDGPINVNHIMVKIMTSVSDPTGLTIKINKTGTPGRFKGNIRVGPVGDPATNQLKVETKREKSFSYFDFTSDSNIGNYIDSAQFVIMEQILGFTKLGGVLLFPVKESSGYSPVAHPTKDALKAAGYEDLIVEYDSKKAWLRIKNQASHFYYSGHGAYKWGSIQVNTDDDGNGIYASAGTDSGDTISPEDWNDNIKLAIFACCSVFDIGNFNGWKDFKNHQSPGLRWVKVRGEAVLLGYNAWSPLATEDEKPDLGILKEYYLLLPSGREATSQEQVMAWMNANADYPHHLQSDNACAIGGDWYYFIRYKRLKKPQNTREVYHAKRRIYKVHKDYWDKRNVKGFEGIPTSGKILIRILQDKY
ncbi:MAG: hypothetical protein K8T10_02085 [Candidatus Eremiobacteraeota bacterium]|nr:hypothetical protein [Candidatus Eremiobacteraeota bacterium]